MVLHIDLMASVKSPLCISCGSNPTLLAPIPTRTITFGLYPDINGYLWILGYKTAENLINIIRSVSNNFSHPFFGNKIETKQMSQMSGATEFIQYFSKTIDNDIDWRPTDTVPEDHYG